MRAPLTILWSLLSACTLDTSAPSLSESQSFSYVYDDNVFSLAPASYWRLGESSGTNAVDSMGYADGVYANTPTLGEPGAIANDTNSSVRIMSSQGEHVYTAGYSNGDRDNHSLVRAHDWFARANISNSWGTSPSGGPWSAQSGAASSFSLISNRGRISLAGTGMYMVGLSSVGMVNSDIQVRVRWNQHPSGGASLVHHVFARRISNYQYYRASLLEAPNKTLHLEIVVGTYTAQSGWVEVPVATSSLSATYALGTDYFIRFQLEGDTLRARAWKSGVTQPVLWQGCGTVNTACLTVQNNWYSSGSISLGSSNFATTAHPNVEFDDLWIQNLGLTVLTWLRVDESTFSNTGAGGTCTGGGQYHYKEWMGKGDNSYQDEEYAFRLFSRSGCRDLGRLSVYIFNCSGGLGSGAFYQPGEVYPPTGATIPYLNDGQWYLVAAVFDSGDKYDTKAHVRLYIDGVQYPTQTDPPISDTPHPGTLYSTYNIVPANCAARFRMGSTDKTATLGGALDEVAIFNRKLTKAELEGLYWSGIGVP